MRELFIYLRNNFLSLSISKNILIFKVLSDEVATSTSAVSFTKQSDESELPKGEDFIKTTVEPMDLENLPDPIDQPEGELDTERKANNLKVNLLHSSMFFLCMSFQKLLL